MKPKAVLYDGDVSVVVMDKARGAAGRRTKAPDMAVAESLHRQISRLHAAHPVPDTDGIEVVVRKPSKWESETWIGKTIGGWTMVPGQRVQIAVNVDEFAMFGKEDPADKKPVVEGMLMPVNMTVPDSVYIATHEWGHAHDKRDDTDLLFDDQAIANRPELAEALSEYGKSHGREAYAEAYTEWMLTKGQTSNALARYFATKYEWPIPEDQ